MATYHIGPIRKPFGSKISEWKENVDESTL